MAIKTPILHALLWIMIVYTGSTLAVTSQIIQPIKSSGDEMALIFIPGANIDGSAYEGTASAIQEATSVRLWIALTKGYLLNTPNPAELPGAIEGAMEDLQKAGMKGDTYIGVAHSLGGIFLAPYAKASSLKAIVLLGSYLTRGNPLKDYPLPVLTLSGELDGQTRITRIASTFRELQSLAADISGAIYSKPVLNVKGMSHAQFASGPMPETVKKYDLEPEISIEQAHKAIGECVGAFVTVAFSQDSSAVAEAKTVIQDAFLDSKTRFQPFLYVKSVDQSDSSSPWAVAMQSRVAGNYQSSIKVTNKVEDVANFIESKPGIEQRGNVIVARTTASLVFSSNPIDISTVPDSPQEVDIKMKSLGAIQQALGRRTLKGSQKQLTCKDLNQLAIDFALNHSTPDAQRRYQERGRPIFLKDDVIDHTGISWVSSGSILKEDDKGLTVQSTALSTSIQSIVVPGMFYCKVISPYRAMEWMNVDSLRSAKP